MRLNIGIFEFTIRIGIQATQKNHFKGVSTADSISELILFMDGPSKKGGLLLAGTKADVES